MKAYEQNLNQLKKVLNNGRSKKGFNIGLEFKAILKKLNDDFGKTYSTRFLRDLISLDKSNRQKSHRIKYLISKSGLRTQRQNKYNYGWIFQSWKTDINEYAHKEKGLIYCEFPRHLFNKEMVIEDIRNKENDFKSNKDKLSLRNGINLGGGVYLKEVKTQQVSKFFKGNTKQVFFMIIGF